MSQDRIPVTVLTGFLGSGKTTLLNYILKEKHEMKIAVIENEFSSVGLDDALLFQSEEDVIEMLNGCVCCTVRGDLIEVLTKKLARHRKKIDMIVLETNGLSDPAPILQTFFVDETVAKMYRLDALVTLADVNHIVAHLDEEKPEGVENESVEQIAFADRIVLTKTDLCDNEHVEMVTKRIREINKFAPILTAVKCSMDLSKILNVNAFNLQKALEMDPELLNTDGEHEHDPSVTSVGLVIDGAVDWEKFQGWLRQLLTTRGNDLFRSKGIINVKDEDYRFVFQGVHMLLEAGMDRPWKSTEERKNTLVFIGRNVVREELEKEFRACLA